MKTSQAFILCFCASFVVGACTVDGAWRDALDDVTAAIDQATDRASVRARTVRERVLPPKPLTLQRRELVVGHRFRADRRGGDGRLVAHVAALFASRFDVAALPSITPLSVWTLGDDVVAAEVLRADDLGGPVLALPALVDGRIRFYDDDGLALEGPFVARPVAWSSVSSPYGPRAHPFTGKPGNHRGVDLSAPRGTPVVSVGDGVVVHAAFHKTAGLHVVVRHKGGLLTRYFHLDAIAADVVAGAKIRRGQGVGVVGATGAVTGPHLHFEVVKAGGPMNPLRLDWPPGPPLPRGQLESHRVLAERLRSMVPGQELLGWPAEPRAVPAPAPAPKGRWPRA